MAMTGKASAARTTSTIQLNTEAPAKSPLQVYE